MSLEIELKSENPAPNGVWFRFHHGTSFSSWGEKITITMSALSANQTNVDVFSECGMPTQVVDWGVNQQNVSNIFAYLDANCQPMPTHNFGVSRTKFCYICGQQLSAEDAFCTNCGTRQD